LNGDGYLDVVAGSLSDYSLILWLGNGDGTFQFFQRPLIGIPVGHLQVADLNNDGRADLLISDARSDTLYHMLGRGDGTFLPRVRIDTAGRTPLSALALADFNGDEYLDLVLTNPGPVAPPGTPGRVAVLLGNGTGSFTLPQAMR